MLVVLRLKESLLSVCLIFLFCFNVYGIDVKTYIPDKAVVLMPVIKKEVSEYFPELKTPQYFPGLMEQESCISLKNKYCFDSMAELKTSREQGVGVFQITRAFKSDGSLRFDSLTEMKKQHKDELKELEWSTIKSRADIQIRTGILMTKDNYKRLFAVTDDYERLAMTDAAYNGGLGGLLKERRYCGLVGSCDPQKWFNNIEVHCLKSKHPLYGQRNACDINREHVYNIFKIRMPKYSAYFK